VHKESKHDGIRYPCDKCKYSSTRPDKLNDHMKRKHM